MNSKIIMLAIVVAVIGAAALMMCDDSDAAAGDVLASGSCGTTLTCEVRSLNADDTAAELEFFGTGQMKSYIASTPLWREYGEIITNVIIPDGLTWFGAGTFYNFKALTSVTLPDSLTSIGGSEYSWGAFEQCTALTSVVFPDGIQSIGERAFMDCAALVITELPDSITAVRHNAFQNCTSITSIAMPAISPTADTGLTNLSVVTYTTPGEWTESNVQYAPHYTSRSKLTTLSFADDRIPAYGVRGLNLNQVTITNVAGDDVLGIYTAPGSETTLSALVTSGAAADIVRLAGATGHVELADGRATADDVTVEINTTPGEYGTTSNVDVLVYPAGYHSREPNDYGVWMTTISILLVVGLLMALILPMIARRME